MKSKNRISSFAWDDERRCVVKSSFKQQTCGRRDPWVRLNQWTIHELRLHTVQKRHMNCTYVACSSNFSYPSTCSQPGIWHSDTLTFSLFKTHATPDPPSPTNPRCRRASRNDCLPTSTSTWNMRVDLCFCITSEGGTVRGPPGRLLVLSTLLNRLSVPKLQILGVCKQLPKVTLFVCRG